MAVLIDKLSLFKASQELNVLSKCNNYRSPELSVDFNHIDNLIFALLFWDEQLVIENSESHKFDFSPKIPLTSVVVPDDVFLQAKKFVTDNNFGISTSSSQWWRIVASENHQMKRFFDDSERHFGAVEYFIVSNYLNCTYLPAVSRRNILAKAGLDMIKPNFRRTIYQHIDKEILDFYNEFNAIMDAPFLKFRIPLLTNYILDNSSSNNIIEETLHLKQTKELQNFRNWLSQIDCFANDGNWVELKKNIMAIDEIVNDFKRIDTSFRNSCEVTLSFPPAITFPFEFTSFGKRKKLGTVFIQELALYSFEKRKL